MKILIPYKAVEERSSIIETYAAWTLIGTHSSGGQDFVVFDDGVAATFEMPSDLWKAFALVVLDEFNSLRAEHGLAARTVDQLKQAIKNKLDLL